MRETPDSEPELAALVATLREGGRTALVQGGGTTMHVAEATAAEPDVVISTAGLRAPVRHDPADLIVSAGAGVTLGEIQAALAVAGQALPAWHPDPGRATLGGLVAGGWESPGRGIFGRLRDRVLATRFVSGEGRTVATGARVVKNVTGFDLTRLLVGSHGTIGVLTEVTLKVHPRPAGLFGVTARGALPDLVRRGVDLFAGARVPLEVIVSGNGSEWELAAFAQGPAEDAASALGPAGAEAPAESLDDFVLLAGAPILTGSGPGPGPDRATVRCVVPRSALTDVVSSASSGDGMVDVGSSTAWLDVDAARVAGLRERCESLGGGLVLLGASPEVRAATGTFWAPSRPPATAVLMARIKAQFDPDRVLGRDRLRLPAPADA